MSAPAPRPSIPTRRDLLQLSAAQLRSMAANLQVASSGRKTAIADCILCHHRQACPNTAGASPEPRDRSPATGASSRPEPRDRSPAAATGIATPVPRTRRGHSDQRDAGLELRVQQLVDQGLQGLEERIVRSLRPSSGRAPTPALEDNISLPSPILRPQQTLPSATRHPRSHQDADPDPALAPGTLAAPLAVQQPALPEKVKQRILKGEYIDFDTLLPEALFPARHGTSPSPSFTLRLSSDPSAADDGGVVIAQKPTAKRTISDLPSWMEAWNLYAQVLVLHFPTRAPALLAYQAIICSASTRFPPNCWLRYDQRFRASAATDKSLRWDCKHNDLWLECFTQPTASQLAQRTGLPSSSGKGQGRRPCTYCGSLYHFPDNCLARPFRTPRRSAPQLPSSLSSSTALPTPPLPLPSRNQTDNLPNQSNRSLPYPCRDFNNSACRRRFCRFRHVCLKYGDQSHGERESPTPR